MTLDQLRLRLPGTRQQARKSETNLVSPSDQVPAKGRNKSKGGKQAKARVVALDFDIPADDLSGILHSGEPADRPGFVHVSHGPNAAPGTHLREIAYRNPQARACIIALANAGYYTYGVKEGATSFIRSDLIKTHWSPILKGEYLESDDGLIHSIAPPLDGQKTKRLLVVFSSIHTEWLKQVGLARYFMHNFPTIQKYMPAGTAVLRISDFGSVMGAYYMNTTHRPDHTQSIQNLIQFVKQQYGIDSDAVVLYGVSKGATGALYHGLRGGFRFVAVDPIVSDDFYVTKVNDAHFTVGGAFPETKEVVFERLFRQLEEGGTQSSISGRSAVICSEYSPQFPYISDCLIRRFSSRMSIYNSLNPGITCHTEVGPRTLNCATMLMNMQLYGMDPPSGLHTIE